MEDQNIEGIEPNEEITTNVPEVEEIEAPATEAVEPSEPKTLRDAVSKAFEVNSEKEAPTPVTAPGDAKEVDPISGREIEPIRAPSTMTPLLREKWGTVPREMQKFWVDRERDMQTKLQETSDERKLAKDFQTVASPYQDTFRKYGFSAVEHAKDLFSMSHQLHSGTAEQKAQLIHELITQFRPDIGVLSHLASGGQLQATQPTQATPSVDELVRQGIEARDTEIQAADASKALESFASDPRNEYLEDLKPIMKQAIDAGFIEGNNLPDILRNAYDFAADRHPEVKQILAGRATAMAVPVAKVNKPVKSVKPSLASGGRGGQTQPRPKNLREAAELAWNKHVGD